MFNVKNIIFTSNKVTCRLLSVTRTYKQHYEDKSNEKPSGWDQARPFEDIPGPMPIPILGNGWRLLAGEYKGLDMMAVQNKVYEKYGKIALFRQMIPNEDFIFIYDCNTAEYVLRNEGIWPVRKGNKSMEYYRKIARKDRFGEMSGLLTEQGENWFKFRSIVNPILMKPQVALQYVKSMDLIAGEFVERMRDLSRQNPEKQMPEDFSSELNKWALESIGVIAIDKRLGCLDPRPTQEVQMIIKTVLEIFDLMYDLDFKFSLWHFFPTPTYKRFLKANDKLNDIISKSLEEAYQKIQKERKPENEQSALEKLLKIDKHVAFIMASDMIIAGIDTTSRVVGAALYFLAKNTKVQNKLREEIKKFLPEKNSPVTKDTLAECKYLRAVIRETLRLAPIALGNLRSAAKDMVIEGYRIPKGTQIFLVHHKMEEKEFPRRNEFIPERWLRTTTNELSHKNANQFSSLPFGFGPRSCVGKRLANLEMETLVAKVMRNFVLEWHHPDMRFMQLFLFGFVDPLKLTVLELQN